MYDDFSCKRCHESVSLDKGCEPTEYCHYCAQELVVELKAKVKKLQKTIRKLRDKQ